MRAEPAIAAHREQLLEQETRESHEGHRVRQEEPVGDAEATIAKQRSKIVREAEEVSSELKSQYATVTAEQGDYVEEQQGETESEKAGLIEATLER